MNEKKTYITEATHRLLCAMLLQAIEDIKPKKFKDAWRQREHTLDYALAIEFIDSPYFTLICKALGLPADRLLKKIRPEN